MDIREYVQCLLVSVVLTGAVVWLFYRSFWGMLLLPIVYMMYRREYVLRKAGERRERLLGEFKDAMQAVSAALLAGYSMENAWREAEKELRELHGEASLMYLEAHQINAAVQMNESLEKALAELARRSGCEEIESFTEVFSFAKRSGGDFAKIVRTTVQRLTGRIEVEREIATVLAGKRFEGRIMNAMPMAILGYLTVASGDFLDVLYGNVLGAVIMSGALGVYVGAMRLSAHILDIQV